MMPVRTSKRALGSGKALAKPSKKKNGKKCLPLQPADAQIFRGLIFYFLPNNDIATARRKRIEKAQEYGAVWAKDWSADVTHVIVDEGLRMPDVTKAIGRDNIMPTHVIVNQSYPPDCIKFRVLLPTEAIRFQVTDVVLKSDFEANGSHQLKKAQRPDPESLINPAAHQIATAPGSQNVDLERKGVMSSGPNTLLVGGQVEKGVLQTELGSQEVDELDKIVAEVTETIDLPFDSEEDDIEMDAYSSFSDEDNHRPIKMRRMDSKKSAVAPASVQSSFSCMRKNEAVTKELNPNSKTIEILDKMAQYYDQIGDHWRTTAYRKCITALKRQREHITTRDQAMKISGVGDRLATKVEEIAGTNSLKRLKNTALYSNDHLLQLFMGIYQVGLPTASRWIAKGHKSLDDLKSEANLTQNQVIGIDHYDDFLARVPRTEVRAHADTVEQACLQADSKMQLIVGGSYRRGAVDSGDIDCIITKENALLENIRTIMIDTVIPQLFRESFLKVALAASSSTHRDHGSKWHGASALPTSKIWRRIDLLFVPWNELGAALLYFTGNDIFNRSIRLLASKKNMRLNQHGLYGDVMRGEKRERMTQGKLLEGRSEERIFDILGVPWRPPQHRIC